MNLSVSPDSFKNDLSEKVNLAASQPQRTLALATELKKWRERVGDQMPTPNGDAKTSNH